VLLALALLLPLAVVAAMLSNGPSTGSGPAAGPIAVATTMTSPSIVPAPTMIEVSATPEPSAVPTPPPSEPPTPVRPPPTSAPVAPSAATGPAHAVRDFYDRVEAHDWDAAIARWSPSMQNRYPPDEWLVDRFRPTTRIDITSLRTLSIDRDAGRARVSVALVEYRRVGPSPRSFVGSWDLVRFDGRWVLDQPHF